MADPVLRAQGLGRNFGGLAAVQDLTFTVQAGEIFAIIGPNGAGKTTTLNLLSGLLEPSAGRVYLDGEDVTRFATYQR